MAGLPLPLTPAPAVIAPTRRRASTCSRTVAESRRAPRATARQAWVPRPTSRTASSTCSARDPVRTGTTLGFLRSGGFVTARIGSGEAFRLAYQSGGSRSPACQGSRSHGGLPARHLRPPAERRRRDRGGGRRGLGQRSRQRHRVRRPRGRRRVRHVPQPPRERRVPHPQPHPELRTQRAPTCSSRQPRRHRSPTRRPPPQATTATTPSSRRTAAPGRSRRTRWPASACPRRQATTSVEGSRGTPRAARPTTRRTASPRTFLLADLGLVPDVPHALPQRGLGRGDAGRDLQVPPHAQMRRPGTASRATWHTVPTRRCRATSRPTWSTRAARLPRSATAGSSRSTTAGRASSVTIRREPSLQVRRSAPCRSRSFPSNVKRVVAGEATPGHPQPSSRPKPRRGAVKS